MALIKNLEAQLSIQGPLLILVMIITHVFKFDAFLVFHVVCFTNLNPSVLRLSHRLARTHLLHVRCVITCLIYQLNVYKLVLLITWRTHWRRSSHYTCFAHASGALAGVGSVHMPSAYNMIGYPSTTQRSSCTI